jgi:hypothetical protein
MADAPVGWERLSSAFDLVISLPTGERASFMATTYGSDAAFRAELESLVAAHDGATAFLDELHAEIIQPALAHDDQLDARVANVDADTRADGVAPGDRIRHFVVHERIGSGGAGIVYRGRDTLLERDVAIKVLAPTVSQDPVARARLVREAQAASRLDDPHVCAIHAIESTADGGLCIVMAFCAGGTLRERLRRGVIPIDDVMTIATHLARGLASAHQAGIVHGDIKPANVGFGEGDMGRLAGPGSLAHCHISHRSCGAAHRAVCTPMSGRSASRSSKWWSVDGRSPGLIPTRSRRQFCPNRCPRSCGPMGRCRRQPSAI